MKSSPEIARQIYIKLFDNLPIKYKYDFVLILFMKNFHTILPISKKSDILDKHPCNKPATKYLSMFLTACMDARAVRPLTINGLLSDAPGCIPTIARLFR